MCGRFSLTQSSQALASAFQLDAVRAWEPRYNMAPTQSIATVVHPSAASRQLRLMRWGLIPSWSKDMRIGARLINARAETVAEKPAFRSAFKQRRCLILADGFYEWQPIAPKQKQPYYFQLADRQPFAFAGLWERWQGEADPIETCTILTTQANELLEPVHDRMPVILAPDTYDRWLDVDTPLNQIHALLHPYAAESMRGYPVSTLVNSPAHDEPTCVQPLDRG